MGDGASFGEPLLQLMRMGFTEPRAREALTETSGNIQKAIDILFKCVPEGAPSADAAAPSCIEDFKTPVVDTQSSLINSKRVVNILSGFRVRLSDGSQGEVEFVATTGEVLVNL